MSLFKAEIICKQALSMTLGSHHRQMRWNKGLLGDGANHGRAAVVADGAVFTQALQLPAAPDMTWACEVAAMRLLKKCKKETLIMLCNDFGIPTSGNKEKLAEEATEQLHYETDDSDDDDDQ